MAYHKTCCLIGSVAVPPKAALGEIMQRFCVIESVFNWIHGKLWRSAKEWQAVNTRTLSTEWLWPWFPTDSTTRNSMWEGTGKGTPTPKAGSLHLSCQSSKIKVIRLCTIWNHGDRDKQHAPVVKFHHDVNLYYSIPCIISYANHGFWLKNRRLFSSILLLLSPE